MVILVVEDESLINLMVSEELQRAGHVVVSAYNAGQAIAILESRNDVHLVFTDIDMPGSMDGLRLSAAVRDRWPPIQIIVASGKHPEAAMPQGSRFLPKPYRFDELCRTVGALSEDAPVKIEVSGLSTSCTPRPAGVLHPCELRRYAGLERPSHSSPACRRPKATCFSSRLGMATSTRRTCAGCHTTHRTPGLRACWHGTAKMPFAPDAGCVALRRQIAHRPTDRGGPRVNWVLFGA